MAEPNPKYNDQTVYNKYQSCEEKTNEDCGCCPPGLVAVYSDCGKHEACLTPNDAEHYISSRKFCAEGFIKLIHPTTGEDLGCVSESNFATIYASLTA